MNQQRHPPCPAPAVASIFAALHGWWQVGPAFRPSGSNANCALTRATGGGRQEKADKFLETYEAVLQGITADPTKPLPGFEPETVNCISLSAMRCGASLPASPAHAF